MGGQPQIHRGQGVLRVLCVFVVGFLDDKDTESTERGSGMNCLKAYIALLVTGVCLAEAMPIDVELMEVKKIWDQAPHNAFTDLIRWRRHFYCAFREGRTHVSADGRIRILVSRDAEKWLSAALLALDGYDLRDADLSVTREGALMLVGGAAPRPADELRVPTGTFVSFSQDGLNWSRPRIVVEPGRWLWRVTWHEGRAYGMTYDASDDRPGHHLDLLVSDDGIRYETLVKGVYETGYPDEVALRFDDNGTGYALVRREGDVSSALLGVSRPPYQDWKFHDLGMDYDRFGGRMHQGGAHTAVTFIDVRKGTMTKLLKLPSAGDNSYPGLVWYDSLLWFSYYSSHEGKTSIYLAKLKLNSLPTP